MDDQPKEKSTLHRDYRLHIIFLVIFLVSTSLRLTLSLVNREANDDHFTVINFIITQKTLPEKPDCWECFQPKLYHFTVASTLEVLGFESPRKTTVLLAGQLINFLAGLAILAIVWLFLTGLPGNNKIIKIIAFGLVALNPNLIGINSQVTNDTFAILFSTAALYSTYLFLQKQRLVLLCLILLFCALSIASKTNSWVAVIAIVVTLLLKLWADASGRKVTLFSILALILGVPLLTVIDPLTQYASNYQNFGSPVLMNIDPQPFPKFFEPTFAPRAGIVSIADGYFTFKYYELLGYPRNEKDNFVYPAHRTSLWSQLYGWSQSVHFNNYPLSWATTGKEYFFVTRMIFLFALPPVILLLAGAMFGIYKVLKGIFQNNTSLLKENSFGLFPIVFAGYIAFIILYSLEYRSYSVMKAIFIYPAILSFPILFLDSATKIFYFLQDRFRWMIYTFEVGMAILFIFYIIDVITLILQIKRYYG